MDQLVSAAVFVPLVILAVTQFVKMAAPAVKGWVTILVAFAVGILIGLVGGVIGVEHVTIAEGIVYALEAIGISVIAGKAGGGASGDANVR